MKKNVSIKSTCPDASDRLRVMISKKSFEKCYLYCQELVLKFKSAENFKFLVDAPLLARNLPLELAEIVHNFRSEKIRSSAIIVNLPIFDLDLGQTPPTWQLAADIPHKEVQTLEFLLVLLGTYLGTPFGFKTQQDGRIIHDILPMKKHEDEQLGCGSKDELVWHTEDAFHPYRGSYLALMCLKNPDYVPTTYCSINDISINDEIKSLLFEKEYFILPDNSHLPSNNSIEQVYSTNFNQIQQMTDHPELVSILSGSWKNPYMRIDPYFMPTKSLSEHHLDAFNQLVKAINSSLQDICLRCGDVLLIDNDRAVHGRRSFSATYNGSDRWLKRLNISANIRLSRALRSSSLSYVIE
ncbi:MAG: guanitoxin biosynthesis L-enduracididine beta-hydroxylase GntD [Bdellovibrionota bacterium]